ncbi:hypothetical protein V9T40_013159 [Parthenolecanium corni]|uniref:Uncharacterized protein n=1 Tax=Parthenolecanium corni TaxID=536013 RepID=A0AAN9Y5U0_9HEMI
MKQLPSRRDRMCSYAGCECEFRAEFFALRPTLVPIRDRRPETGDGSSFIPQTTKRSPTDELLVRRQLRFRFTSPLQARTRTATPSSRMLELELAIRSRQYSDNLRLRARVLILAQSELKYAPGSRRVDWASAVQCGAAVRVRCVMCMQRTAVASAVNSKIRAALWRRNARSHVSSPGRRYDDEMSSLAAHSNP